MYGEIFLKFPHSTNRTALICKSRKENPQKLFEKGGLLKLVKKGGLLKLKQFEKRGLLKLVRKGNS